MGLIKKATELEISSTIKMMLYGSAGAGKTTLALSAPKPLLLDFDGGVKRVNNAHLDGVDIVQVSSWNDIKELMSEDLSAYESIVVDTVGKMMDYIISYKCGARQPQIRDWGGINQEFSWFTRSLSDLSKHIVFVGHRDTRKDGDDAVFIPALREKNYNAIVTDLDLLGYVEMRTVNGTTARTVTFDPTPRNDGKNTCNLPSVMSIPINVDSNGNAKGKNDFIQRIISSYSKMLETKQESARAYTKVTSEIKEAIEEITDAQSATAFIGIIDNFNHVGSSKEYARQMLTKKAAELRIKYDKDSKQYVAA